MKTIKEIKKYLKERQHLLVHGLDLDDPNQVTYIELHMLYGLIHYIEYLK